MRFGRKTIAPKDASRWAEPIVVNGADFDPADTDGLLLLAERLGVSDADRATSHVSGAAEEPGFGSPDSRTVSVRLA